MRAHSCLLPLLFFLGSSSVVVLGAPTTRRATNPNAQSAIEAIMPTSTTCAGAAFPDECRTAAQAAPFIIKAMTGFSLPEIAAMLANIGYESDEMKFKHNVSPGRPGQGTSNMMLAKWVSPYAASIFGAGAIAGKSPDDILAMVTPDEYNFGSAPWFLTQQCGAAVRSALSAGTDAGWAAYMTCLDVDGSDPARLAYWTRAKSAFGL
ncbi:hypothetical protein QBC46DRAFT_371715 [Diplogelasinospora grovesii]|uniref:Uncharacterized protein n=1 Tax=Diplogelasinospora grovesii TaxID=303347 RepID=A0AAN6NGU0_9PEZI|nr:hypothetical protein QBC46DRAFT_371715 [Diplogelasinospora grovesii]